MAGRLLSSGKAPMTFIGSQVHKKEIDCSKSGMVDSARDQPSGTTQHLNS